MNKPYFSLIIPCYNEGPTFETSVKKVVSELGKLKKSWEIIFVEDASGDETKKTVEKLVVEIKNSHAIYHKKNEGRGKTVRDGILKAKGEICAFLDIDLEVSEKYIPIFINEIENGFDMVIAKRFYKANYKSVGRYFGSKLYAGIVRAILEIPIDDTEAGFKFFRRAKILPGSAKTHDNHWFWDTVCNRF